jgi:hypothetical protein
VLDEQRRRLDFIRAGWQLARIRGALAKFMIAQARQVLRRRRRFFTWPSAPMVGSVKRSVPG